MSGTNGICKLETALERAKKFQYDTVDSTVGSYIARRMLDVGIEEYFVVPGDFNLVLLDEFLRFPDLKLISCCNELNAGYAADGSARAKGVAVVVVTFTVGGLSAINAIAGAYSDDLPVIIISGGPNSNDYASDRILHHTTGLQDRSQVFQCFEKVTAKAIDIVYPSCAPAQIDDAFSTAIRLRKPVYLQVSCNISQAKISTPIPMNIEGTRPSNPHTLEAALAEVSSAWNKAVNPVLILGSKVRVADGFQAFINLSDAGGCATATLPDAKGMFPEDHPNYVGTFWADVSSPGAAAAIDSSDCQVFVGAVFNDYTTAGYTMLMKKSAQYVVTPGRVKTPQHEFGCVYMVEFITELAKRIKPNDASMKVYRRVYQPLAPYVPSEPKSPLMVRNICHAVQNLLTKNTALIVETGDSWFNGLKMKLPNGCGYEFQMQYGSIGWSVGALLGYSLALKNSKRVIAMIGDGSFQMTAQEVSTMIRYHANPIVFLINNGGYTIEIQIHDGIYNIIKNWNYKMLIDAFNAEDGKGKSWQVKTEADMNAAIQEAVDYDGFCLIECITDKDDCSRELLEWGLRVASANSRM